MHHLSYSSPEPLEQRIAPAGLVNVTFAGGVLTITGEDGADHDVEIVKTGKNKFRVEGTDTAINELGETSKNFKGVLKHVMIEGGAGADNFELTKLQPLKSLRFDGNEGVDALTTTNFKTKLGGRVSVDLGSESGTVNFSGDQTVVRGFLNLDLGGGGTATFAAGLTKITGNLAITGGDNADSVAVTGDTARFKRISFAGGDGDDSFEALGESMKVKSTITMDGGAGTNEFLFGADRTQFGTALAPTLVDLKLGVGPGTVVFGGDLTELFGTLKVDLGTSGGGAQMNSVVTNVLQHVEITGGAGNDTLGFNGRVTIGKTLTFAGGIGDEVFLATGNLLAVKGSTNIDGGVGASSTAIDVNRLSLGELIITGGTSNDTVSIIADGTIDGNVDIQLGLDGIGPSSVILQSGLNVANGLKFGGTLTIDMAGATVDSLAISNIQVAKAFVAQTGGNVSLVNISNLNAKSHFTLKTGAGADVVNLDNINSRDFTVDTEEGADELRIERNAAFVGISLVKGVATIDTGIGADQIRIGDATDSANLRVSFMRSMTLEAGDGANMRNDILGSNTFKFPPTIVATGGTLTETAAI